MQTPSQRPKPDAVPERYELIVDGVIDKDDLVWDDADREWVKPNESEIGDEVPVYYGVARRVRSN